VQSEAGQVPLDVPRDRDGSFAPQLVPKGQRRIGGLDDMIISLYAGGMTLRDIQFHLVSTIGTDVSHEAISKIVDEISDEVLTWQRRPLEPLYPVIYLDAMIVKVKDGGHTRN
jgi:putative transposase